MEYYVIYDKTTGLMDGGTGFIDREADQKLIDAGDHSALLWHIENRIVKKGNRAVVYLDKPFDPERQKINPKTKKPVKR